MTHRIKYWREKRGMTQPQLAEKTGLSQPAISTLETGRRRFQVNELKLIADALGVGELDLLPLAIVAEIRDDVSEADPAEEPAYAAAFTAKGLVPYRVVSDVVSAAGIEDRALVIGDTSSEAIDGVSDGDVVVADASVPSENVSGLVLRQYLRGGLLTTNRVGRNVSFNIQGPDYEVRLVAVLVKPQQAN